MSMGVAEALAGTDADELREQADTAQYEAKRSGGDRVAAFSALDRARLHSGACGRTARGDRGRSVSVAFQPIWSLGGDAVLGYEALARLPEGFPLPDPRRRSGSPSGSGWCSSSTSSASRRPRRRREPAGGRTRLRQRHADRAGASRDLPALLAEQADLHGIPARGSWSRSRSAAPSTPARWSLRARACARSASASRSMTWVGELRTRAHARDPLRLREDRQVGRREGRRRPRRPSRPRTASRRSPARPGSFVIAEGIEDERGAGACARSARARHPHRARGRSAGLSPGPSRVRRRPAACRLDRPGPRPRATRGRSVRDVLSFRPRRVRRGDLPTP